ncbi:hypothetical protein TcasGA2_TC016186 [Tribolium castaneum]|uniref:DUF8207 domain-containing protein n=1 Tax=Tribolium castaneum TaxID=7070 RepID=D7EIZ1_TRICA|nr:hypothetical protein TcasGA2_TC016186 [Tribolium castaneum]
MNTETLKNTIELKKKIIQKRKQLQRKLALFKTNEIHQQHKFLPITTELKTIAKKLDKDEGHDEHNLKTEKLLESKVESYSKPKFHFFIDTNDSLPFSIGEDKVSNLSHQQTSTLENSNFANVFDVSNKPEISNRNHDTKLQEHYIEEMLHGKENTQFDKTFGVRYDKRKDKFFVGSEQVDFDDSNIIIKDKVYKATPGLYELLFRKQPNKIYTNNDLNDYSDILHTTYAYKRNFDPQDRNVSTRSKKYKQIIAPLLRKKTTISTSTPKTGRGMI